MAVTKEQAMTCRNFKQVAAFPEASRHTTANMQMIITADTSKTIPLSKAKNWRANGKCKVWIRNTEKFQLPIKFGLYEHGYLTNENAHLFEVV